MNISTVAALMAINASNASRRITEEYSDHKSYIINEEQCDQSKNNNTNIKNQTCENLLLKGETKAMTLAETETIKVAKILTNDYGDWELRLNSETLTFYELEECIQHLVEYYKAKEFQLIPYKVDKNFVDIFMMVMKVDKK